MSLSRNNRQRAGFTLVELLVVILIIGILMSILTVALQGPLAAARRAKILVEIGQLKQAVGAYKEARGEYPPCLADYLSGSDSQDALSSAAQKRFIMHLRYAFPRFAPDPNNPGNPGKQFQTLNTIINNNANYRYNYLDSSGSPVPLNLYSLDAAEALVFWLGGFPTPYNSNGLPLTSRKLCGFNLNPTDPFLLNAANMEGRSKPLFDFAEGRLTDLDSDGWLEYVPRETDPPYVYFDSATYSQPALQANGNVSFGNPGFRAYPWTSNGLPRLAIAPGTVVPLARKLLNAGQPIPVNYQLGVQWMEASGFQILCAGLDQVYSESGEGDRLIELTYMQEIPSASLGGSPHGMDQEEEDNLNSFMQTPVLGADITPDPNSYNAGT